MLVITDFKESYVSFVYSPTSFPSASSLNVIIIVVFIIIIIIIIINCDSYYAASLTVT